jgi:hypothetical protein
VLLNREQESRKDPRRRPRARFGVWLAGIYFVLTAALFMVTALGTKPDNVGLDWIPFMVLAMPWSRISAAMAIPGVFLNTLALLLMGTVLEKIWRA